MLSVCTDEPGSQRATVRDGEEIVVGRSVASGLRCNDPRVSKRHCVIRLEGQRILLTDSSSNGTFVCVPW